MRNIVFLIFSIFIILATPNFNFVSALQSEFGNAGKISFNGKVTSAIKCLASVKKLGDTVQREDMQFGRKICVDQKGGGPRCYMEKKSAKEKPKVGEYLISTEQNSGGSGGKNVKLASLQGMKDTGAKTRPSAQKEMDKKQKSCCTKIGKGPKTSHDCLQTKGEPVEETGGLEGGNTKGNKSQPVQGNDVLQQLKNLQI